MTKAGDELTATLLPKSATMAVSVGISDSLGGIGGLTAVFVVCTGSIGALLGPTVLNALGVTDDRARGFALGAAAHTLGTVRALLISDRAAAFATLGMNRPGFAGGDFI